MIRLKLIIFIILLSTSVYAQSGKANGYILYGAATGEIFDDTNRLFASFEIRHQFVYDFCGLWAGADIAKLERYFGGGAYFKFSFLKRFTAQFSIGPGLYYDRGGIKLGHKIEFRSQLGLFIDFYKKHLFGIALNHYSNSRLSKYNPGAESLKFLFGFPF
ncbi:MAG: acyloxyacyl hydrolase [Melioribacteraceae bacterium]|nr:acyloxyacyl hydrolase [Melioribacteraceae bacterium]